MVGDVATVRVVFVLFFLWSEGEGRAGGRRCSSPFLCEGICGLLVGGRSIISQLARSWRRW